MEAQDRIRMLQDKLAEVANKRRALQAEAAAIRAELDPLLHAQEISKRLSPDQMEIAGIYVTPEGKLAARVEGKTAGIASEANDGGVK